MLLKKLSIPIIFYSMLCVPVSLQAMFKCSCFRVQNQIIPITEQSIHKLNSVSPNSKHSTKIVPSEEEEEYTRRYKQEPKSIYKILNNNETELSVLRLFMERSELKSQAISQDQDNNLKSDHLSSASHSRSQNSNKSEITLTINDNNHITHIRIISTLTLEN